MNPGKVLDLGFLPNLDQLLPQFCLQFTTVPIAKDVVAPQRLIILLFQCGQQLVQSVAYRDVTLPSLRLPRLLATYPDLPSGKANVSPLKILKLSLAHTCVQKHEINRIQVGWAGF